MDATGPAPWRKTLVWVSPEATDTDGLELGSGTFVTQVSPAMTGPGWKGQVEAVALDFDP